MILYLLLNVAAYLLCWTLFAEDMEYGINHSPLNQIMGRRGIIVFQAAMLLAVAIVILPDMVRRSFRR